MGNGEDEKRRVEMRLEEQAGLRRVFYATSMGVDSILHAKVEIRINVGIVHTCMCRCDIIRFEFFGS